MILGLELYAALLQASICLGEASYACDSRDAELELHTPTSSSLATKDTRCRVFVFGSVNTA